MTASMRVHAVAGRERPADGNCPRYQGFGANVELMDGRQRLSGRLAEPGVPELMQLERGQGPVSPPWAISVMHHLSELGQWFPRR